MLLAQRRRRPNTPLYLSLKDDFLLMGTVKGFRIFSLFPTPNLLSIQESKDDTQQLEQDQDHSPNSVIYLPGGISALDVFESSNLMVLVAGGKYPKFDPGKVLVWDDATCQVLLEIQFSSPVKSAFLRSINTRKDVGLLVVFLNTKVIIYQLSLPKCKKLYEFDMYWNEYSAFGMSDSSAPSIILAFPARRKGQLQIVDITNLPSIPINIICSGHDNMISSIAISRLGDYVATCSTKGTLIRVWHSKSGTLRHELRRGSEEADIFSMAFDPLVERLCVASDSGTVHFFNLELEEDKKVSIVSSYLPKYFSSEWSFSYCSMPYLTRCILRFQELDVATSVYNIVQIVCDDGSIYKIAFDPVKGGECSVIANYNLY